MNDESWNHKHYKNYKQIVLEQRLVIKQIIYIIIIIILMKSERLN